MQQSVNVAHLQTKHHLPQSVRASVVPYLASPPQHALSSSSVGVSLRPNELSIRASLVKKGVKVVAAIASCVMTGIHIRRLYSHVNSPLSLFRWSAIVSRDSLSPQPKAADQSELTFLGMRKFHVVLFRESLQLARSTRRSSPAGIVGPLDQLTRTLEWYTFVPFGVVTTPLPLRLLLPLPLNFLSGVKLDRPGLAGFTSINEPAFFLLS